MSVFLWVASLLAQDLGTLPPDTWVQVKPTIEQPAAADEKGTWNNAGWNKLVYDSAGRRVLFYDRWYDAKHGGYTIYGNCLYAFYPATSQLSPLKIANWMRVKEQHYRTVPLPQNEKEPTPCDRHVYHAFDYVPETRSVFLSNGANQAAASGEKKGHDLCADTWRFDLETKTWMKVASKDHPRNDLEDGMASCPDTKSIVYAGHGKLWILDLDSGQWRRGKQDLPRAHMGMTVFHDAPRRRMLLAGGGAYDKWRSKEAGFNCLYAFDPKTETATRLADCPTALCRAALAHDTKRDLFVTVAMVGGVGDSGDNPPGMFRYDPRQDAWSRIQPANEIPMKKGWMPLCYDSANDCFWGIAGESFWVFRPGPGK